VIDHTFPDDRLAEGVSVAQNLSENVVVYALWDLREAIDPLAYRPLPRGR